MKKTRFLTSKEAQEQRSWHEVNADGKTLGRISSEIAALLRGKHKPDFTPHNDCGDFVVVINAEKVRLTGNKLTDKMYHHHSGYIGGLKTKSAQEILDKHPERLIMKAVERMLPKNKIGNKQLTKLKVYAGSEHPHTAQNPNVYETKYC